MTLWTREKTSSVAPPRTFLAQVAIRVFLPPRTRSKDNVRNWKWFFFFLSDLFSSWSSFNVYLLQFKFTIKLNPLEKSRLCDANCGKCLRDFPLENVFKSFVLITQMNVRGLEARWKRILAGWKIILADGKQERTSSWEYFPRSADSFQRPS